MENENCFATPIQRPLWDRLIQRFFGYSEPWPFSEPPAPHAVLTGVRIVFGWKDRLRILVGGVAHTKIVIDCENEPGGTSSRAVTFIQRRSSLKEQL